MGKYSFDEVAITRKKVWIEDGRKRQKTKKFSQTLNPFNKNKDGSRKTEVEIMQEITAQADAWMKSDLTD